MTMSGLSQVHLFFELVFLSQSWNLNVGIYEKLPVDIGEICTRRENTDKKPVRGPGA
jgi:hypothetical protein